MENSGHITPMIETAFSPDILAILRLYLEHYPALAEEDRRLYRGLIHSLVNPPLLLVSKDGLQREWLPGASPSDDKTGLTELWRRKADDKPGMPWMPGVQGK